MVTDELVRGATPTNEACAMDADSLSVKVHADQSGLAPGPGHFDMPLNSSSGAAATPLMTSSSTRPLAA
eukprot:3031743-Amphidinium_carterae.1